MKESDIMGVLEPDPTQEEGGLTAFDHFHLEQEASRWLPKTLDFQPMPVTACCAASKSSRTR
jgi:hypothetical protein